MRIATLLPSATDMVLALGHGDSLVGISHSCDPPGKLAALPRMTGTLVPENATSETIDAVVRDHLGKHSALYQLHLDRLEAAAPDVIVSQTLCDVCAVATGDVEKAIGDLESRPRLVDLNPQRLDDVFDDLLRVGEALQCPEQARACVAMLRQRVKDVSAVTAAIAADRRPRVAFLEWLMPPFNGGHWNPELVEAAGGIDLLGNAGAPSRTLEPAEIERSRPDLLLVACCGFAEDRAVRDLERIAASPPSSRIPGLRDGRVYVADGQAYFARPGPGLVDALERLAATLHPQLDWPGVDPFLRWQPAGSPPVRCPPTGHGTA